MSAAMAAHFPLAAFNASALAGEFYVLLIVVVVFACAAGWALYETWPLVASAIRRHALRRRGRITRTRIRRERLETKAAHDGAIAQIDYTDKIRAAIQHLGDRWLLARDVARRRAATPSVISGHEERSQWL